MKIKKESYFKSVPNIGDLNLLEVFLDFENIPVLFLCADSQHSLYLCLCSEIRKIQTWTISKITADVLVDMLKDNITIYQAFAMIDEYKYLAKYTKEDGISYKAVKFENIPVENLPDQNEYLENEENFKSLIEELSLQEIFEEMHRYTFSPNVIDSVQYLKEKPNYPFIDLSKEWLKDS